MSLAEAAAAALEPRIFSTPDITLAATLVMLKYFMQGFDIQYEGEKNRPVAYFKFEWTESLDLARKKYLQGNLSVEPKAFQGMVRTLKSEIENLKRNPHTKE